MCCSSNRMSEPANPDRIYKECLSAGVVTQSVYFCSGFVDSIREGSETFEMPTRVSKRALNERQPFHEVASWILLGRRCQANFPKPQTALP